jgi:NadR type nicotinamide-nucleotide adenylyltransferase
MQTGLTLGKFAPLHRGHQMMIETALAENDHLIVILYDAPETGLPLPLRASWFRRLYPSVEIIEAWGGPSAVGDQPEITRLHDEYIRSVLGDRRIDRFYSSEFYGEHVSRGLRCADRRVDPERRRVPVSGTQIRSDPFAYRRFLDPIVYRELLFKVLFVGAPSTGKTTIAERLAERYGTVWMPEYGREYWTAHQVNRRLTLEQLVEIAEGHRQREDALALEANRYFFVDTDATTTRMFSLYYHGTAHPRLVELANQSRDRYDIIFLCEDDIPYEDVDRSGEANRTWFQERIREDLAARGTPFTALKGAVEERMECVSDVLRAFRKFG